MTLLLPPHHTERDRARPAGRAPRDPGDRKSVV